MLYYYGVGHDYSDACTDTDAFGAHFYSPVLNPSRKSIAMLRPKRKSCSGKEKREQRGKFAAAIHVHAQRHQVLAKGMGTASCDALCASE